MSQEHETRDKDATVVSSDNDSQINLTGEKSPSVARIEASSAHLTLFNHLFLFISIFFIAYIYSLKSAIYLDWIGAGSGV